MTWGYWCVIILLKTDYSCSLWTGSASCKIGSQENSTSIYLLCRFLHWWAFNSCKAARSPQRMCCFYKNRRVKHDLLLLYLGVLNDWAQVHPASTCRAVFVICFGFHYILKFKRSEYLRYAQSTWSTANNSWTVVDRHNVSSFFMIPPQSGPAELRGSQWSVCMRMKQEELADRLQSSKRISLKI